MGVGDHGPRLHENIEQSLMQAVQPDLLGGGNDDAPHPVGHLPAAQHLGGGPHVLHPAVGAGADDHLVDLHLAAVVHGFCVFGQMGEGNGGAQSGEVDRDSILILRVGIGLEYPRFPLETVPDIRHGHIVYREDAVLAPASMAMLAMQSRSSIDREATPRQ